MKKVFYRILAIIFNFFRALFPLKANRVTLLSPHNASFNDSLGEIRKELKKRGEYDFNCISHGDFSSPLKAIAFFTVKTFKFATSKYVFMNDNFMPMGFLNFRKEAVLVQLWHGEGAFKQFGLSIELPKEIRELELAADKKLSFVICSAEGVRHIYASAFGIDESRVLPLGSPRADALLNASNAKELRADFEEKHPQCKGKKIVLYAPTFRDDPKSDAEFLKLFDCEKFTQALGDEYCLLIRLHPQVHGAARLDGAIDVTDYKSVNELTLISDMLITDYSSICMDFVLLDKPCVFFAPDMEEYLARRPVYYDYETFVPGEIVRNTDELIAAVKNAKADKKLEEFKKLNLEAVDGKSCQRILDRIIS